MAEESKEVRVKDLVVRADNVVFERPNRDRDFLFGPRRRREEMEMHEEHTVEEPVMEEVTEEHDEENHDDHQDRRPPFFWM